MAIIENSKEQHEPVRTIAFAGDKIPSYIKRKAKEVGIEVVEIIDNPQVIISYGGDGTFLGCLRDFEQPILPMRRNEDYRKCRFHTPWNIFEDIKAGRCTIYNIPQISCSEYGNSEPIVRGYNDITLRPIDPRSAIRLKVKVGSSDYGPEIVSDGVVACTPFGSSAYFRSITRSIIRGGWGFAFNNSCEQVDHLFLPNQINIRLEITRGPACIFGDNSKIINLTQEQKNLLFYLDNNVRRQCLGLDSLFCKECQEKETGRPAGWRHV